MNAESILQESWTLFRKHWRYLSLVAAINFVISLVLSFAVTFLGVTSVVGIFVAGSRYNGALVTVLVFLLLLLALAVAIGPILTGASAFAAKHVLGKTTGDPLIPYKEAFDRYRAFLPVLSLAGIAIVLGMLLLVVPGIIAMVAYFCSTYVVVAEGGTTSQILARSVALGKANAGTILLLLLVIGMVSFACGLVLSHLPFVGPFLAGYTQSIIGVWSMLVVAVFYAKATAKSR